MRKRGTDTCMDCLKASMALGVAGQIRLATHVFEDGDGNGDTDGEESIVVEVVE